MGQKTAKMYLAADNQDGLFRVLSAGITGKSGRVAIDTPLTLLLCSTSQRNGGAGECKRLRLDNTVVKCQNLAFGIVRAEVYCQRTNELIARITPCSDTLEHCLVIREITRLDAA